MLLVNAVRQVQAHRLKSGLEEFEHVLHTDPQVFCKLLRGRFASKFLLQAEAGPFQPIELVPHVDWKTNGSSLVGDRARNRLSDPPEGIGAKFVATGRVKFFDGT